MTSLSSTAGLRKLAAIGLVLLCGCPGTPPKSETVDRPFHGQEVELVVPASYQLPAVWDVALNEWMDQSGASVRWSEYSGNDENSLEKKLSAPVTSGGRVILFPLRQLGELDRHLNPIEAAATPASHVEDPAAAFFATMRERLGS